MVRNGRKRNIIVSSHGHNIEIIQQSELPQSLQNHIIIDGHNNNNGDNGVNPANN